MKIKMLSRVTCCACISKLCHVFKVEQTTCFHVGREESQLVFRCKHCLLKGHDRICNALPFHMFSHVHEIGELQEPLSVGELGMLHVFHFKKSAKRLSTLPLDNQGTLLCRSRPGSLFPTSSSSVFNRQQTSGPPG